MRALHVRNRFFSAADGSPFRVSAERDANAEVHAAIGKMMRIRELADHMITTSSNLATNLLLDLVGVETVQRVLEHFRIDGIDFRRGVEDERAFAPGSTTASPPTGLVSLLRLIEAEEAFSPALSREMLDILHQQEFKNGIPAALPRAKRGSRTRPARSRPSPTTPESCIPRTESRTSSPSSPNGIRRRSGRSATIAAVSQRSIEALDGVEHG